MNPTDARRQYDELASRAKVVFVDAVQEHLTLAGQTQKDLADATGYAAVSVSEFLRQPDRVPENFIRVASLTVPALAGEYLRFRATADAPFYDRADEAQVALLRASQAAADQARTVAALEAAQLVLADLLERLRPAS